MDLFNWLGQKLGINQILERLGQLEKRVDEVEIRLNALEGEVQRGLKHHGDYKNRSDKELQLMKSQIQTLLDTVNNVLDTLEYKEGAERAKRLRSRLKNNLTRINKNINAA